MFILNCDLQIKFIQFLRPQERFVQSYILRKGTRLYRFIDIEPAKVVSGMTRNKGKDGRCNKYSDIYYCSKSIDGLLQEFGFNEIQGSLIVSIVQEPIILGMPVDERVVPILRGRTKNEPPELVHDILHKELGNDIVIDYEQTSEITELLLKIYPDGICYPSVHSIDTVINGYIFQTDEDTGFSNIALSESGYKKIRELKPKEYSYNPNNEKEVN